jgi:hypothetical protein
MDSAHTVRCNDNQSLAGETNHHSRPRNKKTTFDQCRSLAGEMTRSVSFARWRDDRRHTSECSDHSQMEEPHACSSWCIRIPIRCTCSHSCTRLLAPLSNLNICRPRCSKQCKPHFSITIILSLGGEIFVNTKLRSLARYRRASH